MSIITALSKKKLLIIDDLPGMRSQMKLSMAALGFAKVTVVADAKAALAVLPEGFDIILCDYYLGDRTNGQQFLEYLRQQQLIAPWVIFIMVTAERSYDQVMRAAEVLPDDYLVKPFTAGQLQTRLEKLMARRERFYEVDDALARQDWNGVVAACDMVLSVHDKSFLDAMHIKGDALLQLARFDEAEALFRQVLALRPLGWACLGLGRALLGKGDAANAEAALRQGIDENPHLMPAYDVLADLLYRQGQGAASVALLQQAADVSPGSLARARTLGKLAAAIGEHALAESTLKEMLRQHQHSPVKAAGDYGALAQALVAQGKHDEALATVSAARSDLGAAADRQLLATEALALASAGQSDAARTLLAEALGDNQAEFSADEQAALAKACYLTGDTAGGERILRQLVQSDPDDAGVLAAAEQVLTSTGQADSSATLVAALVQECVDINNAGVRLAYEGKYEEASRLLGEAAARVPGNLQFLGNAALVLAAAMLKEGVNEARMQACLQYRQAVFSRQPQHAKLRQIDAALKKLRSSAAGSGG